MQQLNSREPSWAAGSKRSLLPNAFCFILLLCELCVIAFFVLKLYLKVCSKKSQCFLFTAVIFPLYNQCSRMWENAAAVTCKPQRLVIWNQEKMRHCFLSLWGRTELKENWKWVEQSKFPCPSTWPLIHTAGRYISFSTVYFMVNVFQHCWATTSSTNKQWEYKCREGGGKLHHGLVSGARHSSRSMIPS